MSLDPPPAWTDIEAATKEIGFTLGSEPLTGSLLRALAASKPGGRFLELGTGTGIGTAWILNGMDSSARLTSVDNDERVIDVARRYLGQDARLTFQAQDGAAFLQTLTEAGAKFDFIFADTWAGKFTHLNEALGLLAEGGLYVVDDLLAQPTWDKDHAPKVAAFIATLERRENLHVAKLDWATGLIVATKVSMPSSSRTAPEDATIANQIEAVLREYYRGFEDGDLKRMVSGMTDDFSALFHIPTQSEGLISFDKESITTGFQEAFRLYSGRNPRMTIRDVVVVTRSDSEALASYTMDFSLHGERTNTALTIADLRAEGGRWRITRLYENKQR